MRELGILIMAAAVMGAGAFAAMCLREKLEILQLLRQMIYHLKGQILYANAPLSEALREVGTRFSEGREGHLREPGQLFLRIAERMEQENHTPAPVIWHEEVAALPAGVPLRKQDRGNLAALGENLGYADLEMQERTILFYLEQTDDAIAALKQEVEGKTGLYQSLGVAAGIFLMIVLA